MNTEYSLIYESIKAIVQYLNKNYSINDVKLKHSKKITVGDDYVETKNESILDISEFLFSTVKIFNKISTEPDLSIVKTCINKLRNDPWFGLRYSDELLPLKDHIDQGTYQIILAKHFISNYFKVVSSFDFEEKIIEDIYQNYLEEKELVKVTSFVPLHGFIMDVEKIDLINDVAIEKMNDNDYNLMYAHGIDVGLNPLLYIYTKYKISVTYTYNPLNEEIQKNKAKNMLTDVITTLRLLSQQRFYAYKLFIDRVNTNYTFKTSSRCFDYEYYSNEHRHGEYRLNKTEINAVLNIFEQLQSNSKDVGILRVGLEKFNQSFSRFTLEDKILDYCTSLDSTLLSGNRSSNFYQLCVRCAILLKDISSLNVFDFIQILFDFRNDIIHNGEKITKAEKVNTGYDGTYDISSFLKESENIVRQVLIRYLEVVKKGKFQDINAFNKNGLEREFFKMLPKLSTKSPNHPN